VSHNAAWPDRNWSQLCVARHLVPRSDANCVSRGIVCHGATQNHCLCKIPLNFVPWGRGRTFAPRSKRSALRLANIWAEILNKS
jgi:hypothetical protein